MPFETSKSIMRRNFDRRFATTYFVGDGIDVGCGPDPLSNFAEMFPLMKSCRSWDEKDGDGTYLEGIKDESLDFVHASHSLEHLDNFNDAMSNWIRVLKGGGHMILLLPDEDMFEQGVWPSRYSGPYHKTSWTIYKSDSWCPASKNVVSDLVMSYADVLTPLKIELLDATYHYKKPPMDQTRIMPGHVNGECAIEVIFRKKTDKERKDKGRFPPPDMFVYKI